MIDEKTKKFFDAATRMTAVDLLVAIEQLFQQSPKLRRVHEAMECVRGSTPCANCCKLAAIATSTLYAEIAEYPGADAPHEQVN